jgi:hypothetical protein
MDVKGLRTLNLVGTILFCVIGLLIVSAYYIQLTRYSEARNEIEHMLSPEGGPDSTRESEYSFCKGLLLLWLCIIIIFTLLLLNYTVFGLDRGNYTKAKSWTLIGIIVGFAGGILPLIIFIISYVSFDDAVRSKVMPPYPYQQAEPSGPGEALFCRFCGKPMKYVEEYKRWYCFDCRKYQ